MTKSQLSLVKHQNIKVVTEFWHNLRKGTYLRKTHCILFCGDTVHSFCGSFLFTTGLVIPEAVGEEFVGFSQTDVE